MPRTLNPCSYLPRRLQIVASLSAFLLFCIFFLGTSKTDDYDPLLSKVPYSSQLQTGAHQAVDAAHQVVDHLPKVSKNLPHIWTPTWLNPFGAPAHMPPPEQANSTSGETKWFDDWKWKNPFSSSITLDEERSVLPPKQSRPYVYTYYDPAFSKQDEARKYGEQELLQTWRRAWWAKGFKPVILGPPEARNNPQYRVLIGLELEKELESELLRWLAWGNMGTGVLSNWLLLPMASYDDPLLTFIRRGEYPKLTRYDELDNGLFVGSKDDVEKAIKTVLSAKNIKQAKTLFEALPSTTFTVDKSHDGVAFYSATAINSKYYAIKEKLQAPETRGDALAMLATLINSHLHMTWQNIFTSGVAVLKPLPAHTTTLIEPAIEIARNLTQCPDSPIPASCPPNNAKCHPCVSSHPQSIGTPPVFRNTSTLFTIATVPHPYTRTSLMHNRDDLNVKFIRRETEKERDAWINAATKELLGNGLSSFGRLPSLKDAVASDFSQHRTLWLTGESPPDSSNELDIEELDWTFGFRLPRPGMDQGKSDNPVPSLDRRPPAPKQEFGDAKPPSEAELAKEKSFLAKAKVFILEGGRGSDRETAKRTRDVVEAWNLADTEAWKFVRAFEARRKMERKVWEEEEEDFQGKGYWDRWTDKVKGT